MDITLLTETKDEILAYTTCEKIKEVYLQFDGRLKMEFDKDLKCYVITDEEEESNED